MVNVTAADLGGVTSFDRLLDLLRNKMEWPIPEDYGFDDVVFEYEAAELGLKKEEAAKVREVHQLRPLTTNQPWGIFFISMEEKALPVTVLRRILKALVVKKRAGAQTPDRRAWEKSDLIFAASFGASGARELAFVHFSDGASTGDLPVMKVLGWNAKDTQLHNDYVAKLLREKLIWPDDAADAERWRKNWASAFELRLNETIRTSKELAQRLAALAAEIRARANQLLAAEADTGPMRTMLEAFRKNLIHDLDEDGFADMFAQTIAYGLLAASISRLSEDGQSVIVADNLSDMVPRTNPFLKELFESFLKIGGRDKRAGLDFDELGVRDVVDLLNAANMAAVLRDFGDRNPKEDPVIHFYELFLKEYDPKKRMQRGVFYTPRPVVNFIVRGVDEILRTEFGLPLGLADTSTWAELATRNDKITIPDHVDPNAPFVQILDPATGTGTFLVEVIDLIHKRMEEHWRGQGKSAAEIKAAWNAYVPAHLLPRLTAFELMMAPYTIAHMKVGLKLQETGYTFGSDERARIFLTNALEPARDLDMEFIFMSEALAHEAQAANEAKARATFTAIIGNPPYSLMSGNLTPTARALVLPYKSIGGQKIKERGALQAEKNIQDDYVKFFRFTEEAVQNSRFGVASLITNHSYLENRTLRGMRFSIMKTFDQIDVIDLHGSVTRSIHSGDENIFDIQQGVALCLLVKSGYARASVNWGQISGERESKFERLLVRNWSDLTTLSSEPIGDIYSFVPITDEQHIEYQSHSPLNNIMGNFSSGIITARDHFLISFDKINLLERLSEFTKLLPDDARSKFFLGKDTNDWKVTLAQSDLRRNAPIAELLREVTYRPFDKRYLAYTGQARGILCNPRYPIMRHLLDGSNLSLLVCRQQSTVGFRHILVTDEVSEGCSVSNKTREITSVFPLWLEEATGEGFRRANFTGSFGDKVSKQTGLIYQNGLPRGEQQSMGEDYRRPKAQQLGLLDTPWDGRGDLQTIFGPRDLFDYIYAVLHSPGYRSRYAEFLKSDFPRIPTPKSRAAFADLIPLGRELVALHLLKADEATILKNPDIRFAGSGEARVEKGYPVYQNGKVMINPTRWFEDVPKATWEFQVGGYQVCQKWLKDRAGKGGKKPSPGRVLTEDDILHYRRVVAALTETRRLMAEIDQVIEKHGGWPGAFVVGEVEDGQTV